MIHVVAIITTHPGQREKVLSEFRKVVPEVHAEKGCIEYQPVTDTPDAGAMQTPAGDNTFIVIEKWETLDDLQAHSGAEHMQAYAAKVGPMIADRCIHILS